MSEVNTLSAAAFNAIALAQATYGVPDRLIAKIAQCSHTQIYRNRVKAGWSVRSVSTAYLRGDKAEVMLDKVNSPNDGLDHVSPLCDDRAGTNTECDVDVLRAAIDRLLLRLTREMAVEDVDEIDALALKRLELIGNASKQVEKLVEMRAKLIASGRESAEAIQKDPNETARVLKKIEKRVHDLAERRARDIISGAVDSERSADTGPRMDDQRPPKPIGDEQA